MRNKMHFLKAMKELDNGNKIRLRIWDKNMYFNKLDNGQIVLLKYPEKYSRATGETISMINSTGWQIFRPSEEEIKLHTFEEALTALKNGKKIRRQSSITEYYFDKASSRILKTYDVEVHKGEAWCARAFSDGEVLANDWIIEEKN
jgi:hypothetical protein